MALTIMLFIIICNVLYVFFLRNKLRQQDESDIKGSDSNTTTSILSTSFEFRVTERRRRVISVGYCFTTVICFIMLLIIMADASSMGGEAERAICQLEHMRTDLVDGSDAGHDWVGLGEIEKHLDRAAPNFQSIFQRYITTFENKTQLDFVFEEMDKIKVFMQNLTDYKDAKVINFEDSPDVPHGTALWMFSDEMPTKDDHGSGFTWPYYPIDKPGTGLYNVSKAVNNTALSRLEQIIVLNSSFPEVMRRKDTIVADVKVAHDKLKVYAEKARNLQNEVQQKLVDAVAAANALGAQ